MEKQECVEYLAELEGNGMLAIELKKEFPRYVRGDCVDKFRLLNDLERIWNGKKSWED